MPTRVCFSNLEMIGGGTNDVEKKFDVRQPPPAPILATAEALAFLSIL